MILCIKIYKILPTLFTYPKPPKESYIASDHILIGIGLVVNIWLFIYTGICHPWFEILPPIFAVVTICCIVGYIFRLEVGVLMTPLSITIGGGLPVAGYIAVFGALGSIGSPVAFGCF